MKMIIPIMLRCLKKKGKRPKRRHVSCASHTSTLSLVGEALASEYSLPPPYTAPAMNSQPVFPTATVTNVQGPFITETATSTNVMFMSGTGMTSNNAVNSKTVDAPPLIPFDNGLDEEHEIEVLSIDTSSKKHGYDKSRHC